MNAREEILAGVRAAFIDDPAEESAEDVPVPSGYRRAHHNGDPVDLFCDRVADYHAVVHRIAPDGLSSAVAGALDRRAARTVLVPSGVPGSWLEALAGFGLLRDAQPLDATDLDATDGVLTGCAGAIAETGTIVLDHGPGQGRRALTLVPDYHLVVVYAAQIVADVPDALSHLDPRRPHTFISGPSATSDIELDRVEGVHGPRTLEVLVVTGEAMAGAPQGLR